ncbi:ABC-type multidrug transport system fused ATPase/permease subunit [Streptomyces sp. DSM 42143]|uniref:hypothetical protein n=1 Tax=Streptomyces TaxID=1883 RepID=UPI0025AF44E2|nr:MULTISPECIES: hypothetical protein [unclassified Streptomyces]MDN3256207.1 hypothetical protein [Streptomyces sp. MA25(2023)]MDQ0389919.1 ABC-type multidrug transport system fused ATPase/permease subunit [Streptomyces sp. DSM 42143]
MVIVVQSATWALPGAGRVGLPLVRAEPPRSVTAPVPTATAPVTVAVVVVSVVMAVAAVVTVVVVVAVVMAVVVVAAASVTVVVERPTDRTPQAAFEFTCSVQSVVHEIFRGAHDIAQRVTERRTGTATGHAVHPFRKRGEENP